MHREGRSHPTTKKFHVTDCLMPTGRKPPAQGQLLLKLQGSFVLRFPLLSLLLLAVVVAALWATSAEHRWHNTKQHIASVPILRHAFGMDGPRALMHAIEGPEWASYAAEARDLPKFDASELIQAGLPNLHTHIVAIHRYSTRKEALERQLEAEGIRYALHWGIDGISDIPVELIQQYASRKIHRRIGPQMNNGTYFTEMLRQRESGTISQQSAKQLEARLELAARLSFFTLLHRMVAERWRHMLVFEDDARISPGFGARLMEVMGNLPESWEVLHLNACNAYTGEGVAPGLKLFKEGVCNIGFVITLKLALRILSERSLYAAKPFDRILMYEGHAGRSFIASPPLVEFAGGGGSIIKG